MAQKIERYNMSKPER